jgi:hypothetical protein
LQRLLDGLTLDDRRRLCLQETTLRGVDRTLAVDRIAQRVDDPTQ